MNVVRNDGLARELLAEMWEEIQEDRTGQHPSVTDLIGCLTKSYYDTEETNTLEHNDKTKMFFLIGLGLERALLVKRKETPVAGVTDGIYWHVDSIDQGLLEVKSTRANPKRIEGGDWNERWMRQIKSYLKGVGETHADFAIVYIIQAQLDAYRLTFSQFEIDTHWEWMKVRRDVWVKAKADKKSPKAFHWNEKWECDECPYKVLCELKASMGE